MNRTAFMGSTWAVIQPHQRDVIMLTSQRGPAPWWWFKRRMTEYSSRRAPYTIIILEPETSE